MRLEKILILNENGIKKSIELSSNITLLVGPNGTGKTFFLEQIMNRFKSNNKIAICYSDVSFEKEDLSKIVPISRRIGLSHLDSKLTSRGIVDLNTGSD